jgi:glycosyltransferase involved in cell wall biosynthesis
VKIAIDARMIRPDSMHGIARYVYELLCCIKDLQPEHKFYIFVNANSPLEDIEWPEFMELVHLKSSWISFSEQLEIPKILKSLKADLLHAPSFVAPIIMPCELIMTIHDLNHLVLPQFYTPFHQFYYQFFVRSCIRRSRFILTVSQFSKKEIVRNLKLNEDKVFVTYNGVASNYKPVTDQEKLDYVREIYELPEKFIFCLSNNKPHKNVQQLVRAFCYSDLQVPLVLACPVDKNLIRISENYGKKHLVYFTKFIDEEHLPAVYSLTHLFVYPSTYEGFGLPPLEAISCGAPVVVARSSSLPEVVGNHAIFVNPYDHKAIANALQVGCSDESIREKLREGAMPHAKSFSWHKMAKETVEIYERCHMSKSGKLVEASQT